MECYFRKWSEKDLLIFEQRHEKGEESSPWKESKKYKYPKVVSNSYCLRKSERANGNEAD